MRKRGDRMKLDLLTLNNNLKTMLEISQKVEIPKEWYQKTSIINFQDLWLEGTVTNNGNTITLKANISGIMIIEDSISLDPIEYPFSCEIEENLQDFLKNNENTLDITEILWQNIMLEVPLRLSNVENFDEYQGDGWKLISEDSIQNTNNPFSELKDMMREE